MLKVNKIENLQLNSQNFKQYINYKVNRLISAIFDNYN